MSNDFIKQNRCFPCISSKINPNKDFFETLGFVFDDVNKLCTLPNEWYLKKIDENAYYIIDNKRQNRGVYYYKSDFETYMILTPKYRVMHSFSRQNHVVNINVYVLNGSGIIIYDAGQCNANTYKETLRKAHSYLNEHFPEWRDATKYWD